MWAIRAIALDCTSATSGMAGAGSPDAGLHLLSVDRVPRMMLFACPSSVRMWDATASPSKSCIGELMLGWVTPSRCPKLSGTPAGGLREGCAQL